jgi:hypothetical protein
MPNQADPNAGKSDTPSSLEEFHTAVTGEDNELDRSAGEAAEKAQKTEKRYDRDHGIFTK